VASAVRNDAPSAPAAGGEVLPQADHREHAQDADGDERGLDDTRGDVAESDGFVLPFQDGEQHDGGTDVGDTDADLQEGAQGDLPVGAGTGDVVGIAQQRAVKQGPGDREDDRDDEQHPGDERGLPGAGHGRS
jgi:hypothetical protein